MPRKIFFPETPDNSVSIESPEMDFRLIVAYRRGKFPTFNTVVYSGFTTAN